MNARQFAQTGYTLLSGPNVNEKVIIGVKTDEWAPNTIVILDSDDDMIILTKAQILELFKLVSETL